MTKKRPLYLWDKKIKKMAHELGDIIRNNEDTIDTTKVNRFEVIDWREDKRRILVESGKIQVSIQDNGRTLKVFLV